MIAALKLFWTCVALKLVDDDDDDVPTCARVHLYRAGVRWNAGRRPARGREIGLRRPPTAADQLRRDTIRSAAPATRNRRPALQRRRDHRRTALFRRGRSRRNLLPARDRLLSRSRGGRSLRRRGRLSRRRRRGLYDVLQSTPTVIGRMRSCGLLWATSDKK